MEPSICGTKTLRLKSSSFSIEDAHEPDVLAAGVLQVGEPGDHLAAVQAIGAAHIGLAGFFRMRLGLALAPLKAEPPGHSDRVDEHRVVLIERRRVAELLADGRIMRRAVGLIVAQRRVRPADEHREIPTFRPGAWPDGVDRQPLDGEITGFEIKEQRGGVRSVQSSVVLPIPTGRRSRP